MSILNHRLLRMAQRMVRAAHPFILAIAVAASLMALISGYYFALPSSQWSLFLGGVLVAALLAEATRMSRSEWVAIRRTAQLSLLKSKLEQETQLRQQTEVQLTEAKNRLHLLDEVLPIMIVFVDAEGICRYHNHAFLDWLHLRAVQVNGKPLQDVLGAKAYQEITNAKRKSLDGHIVHYERTQIMPDGSVYKLAVQHLPQFGADGKVLGFYMLLTDITEPDDIHTPTQAQQFISTLPPGASVQNLFIDSFSAQVIGEKDAAARIMAAIEKGEFCLFSQFIRPLSAQTDHLEYHEILIRLMEEEENMMPPGAFFPLAEQYGLMPHLDRWVVRHVVQWVAQHAATQERTVLFFINIADATLADPTFPAFLQGVLLEYAVAGTHLCFEVPDTEVAVHNQAVIEFVRRVRQCQCRVALSGFGRIQVSFDALSDIQIDFLKIDGSIVLEMLRDPVATAKVTAIDRVAKELNIKTIAEFVEHAEIVDKLTELGVDFAQGFGIAHPQPLALLFAPPKNEA